MFGALKIKFYSSEKVFDFEMIKTFSFKVEYDYSACVYPNSPNSISL